MEQKMKATDKLSWLERYPSPAVRWEQTCCLQL